MERLLGSAGAGSVWWQLLWPWQQSSFPEETEQEGLQSAWHRGPQLPPALRSSRCKDRLEVLLRGFLSDSLPWGAAAWPAGPGPAALAAHPGLQG